MRDFYQICLFNCQVFANLNIKLIVCCYWSLEEYNFLLDYNNINTIRYICFPHLEFHLKEKDLGCFNILESLEPIEGAIKRKILRW